MDRKTSDIPQPAQAAALSPWPVRLLVYAIFIVIALAAIHVIDGHAMARQAQIQNTSAPPGLAP